MSATCDDPLSETLAARSMTRLRAARRRLRPSISRPITTASHGAMIASLTMRTTAGVALVNPVNGKSADAAPPISAPPRL